jgi:hypothetical protein
MRDDAGTLVRHAIVAENGVRAVVCTLRISGGGPTGAAGVVVVVGSDGVVVAGTAGIPGSARNRRSATYGESKPTAGVSPGEVGVWLPPKDRPCTAETRRRPGVDWPPVSRPVERKTRRPPGGANVKGGAGPPALAAEAVTGAESDPGRASLKPIVEPPTTASRSQQIARRGTL